jgi:hypothetical protein
VVFKHRNRSSQALFDFLKQQQVVCAMRGGGIRYSPHCYNSIEGLEKAVDLANSFK